MNEVITYLLNFAFDHGFEIVWTNQLKSSAPSCAIPKNNKIIINGQWKNKDELPFQIAHEIGHMLNKDEGVLYYSSYSSHSKIEADADNRAIDLLIDYCVSNGKETENYSDFMYYYSVPLRLEENAKRRYAIYFNN
ncbi:hypothetical protein FC65_GL001047 [Ligilactobacillus acidipiscis DSM 15836]|uniref:IrrE N-terminal-like domain-containing protein n=1 Tax=Ligilactobacillus acidipiscis DSM 15836 TaxID=1423716 RepID=A0ABR5PHM1_9LACO|nr:ImmA/IrrE family metallo-endopeptidase [Ligilactobacillus acidipiscis]KRM20583.1 hypothetical protein FC65_GL001047 [Ligilactobacillus acidipiscis DSM 15836]GAW64248.1 hypothetical protein Lacidipiscis_01440 [Ligilactobacillus acidipiscis]GEN21950.1 hypothetical protein LAC02_52310 [Ligilactobacillus acidipiscis]